MPAWYTTTDKFLAGAKPNPRITDSPDPLIPAGATPLMCRRCDDAKLHLALLKHAGDPTLKCAKVKTAIDQAREALKSKKTRTIAGAQRALDAMLKA